MSKANRGRGLPRPEAARPGRPQPSPPPRGPGWAAALVLIAVAGAFAYSTSFRGVFALDDVRGIERNDTIRSLWPLSGPLAPPGRSTVAGRPIANLSFAVNYALAPASGKASRPGADPSLAAVRLDPAPFHAGNLLIHLLAAMALYGVVRRTLLAPSLATAFGGASGWIALAVALVWVVHPLTTAAVTYVVQRVESLMSLFYLLTIYCAIRAFGGGRAGWWSAAAIGSCALGMATKEIMVTAPLVVTAWWWLFVPPDATAARRRARVLMPGLFLTWTVLAVLVWGEHRTPSLALGWDASRAYLLAQAEVVLHYLRLAVLPAPLVFLYDWPLGTSLGAVAWQVLLLAALVALTAVGVARRVPASLLGVWFFVVLAPSSSVLPIVTEVAAEHRMYLPLMTVIAAAVIAVFLAGRRWIRSPRVAAGLAAVALVAAVGVLAAETRDRNRVYWSAESLWGDTVLKRPGDSRARVAYAEALAQGNRLEEAEVQLEAAMRMAPDDAAARVRMGAVLAQQRRFDEALPHLERAVALRPDDPDAHRLLADIYAARGQDLAAVRHLEQALATVPGDPRLLGRLASLLAWSRDPLVRNVARAREIATEAVRVTGGRDARLVELLKALENGR